MEMQPGFAAVSEADIVSATEALEVRRDMKRAQAGALQEMKECICLYALPGSSGAFEAAVAVYIGHCVAERLLDIEALEFQIAYNKRALEAYRSSILLPSFGPRKPSN